MIDKIDVASLYDYDAAHFLNNQEEIRQYLKLFKEEDDQAEYSGALRTIFMAIGANTIAHTLNVDVEQVWNTQQKPLEHPESLQQIIGLIESDTIVGKVPNRHMGSNFEDFLREEGIYDEVTARAVKRISEFLK